MEPAQTRPATAGHDDAPVVSYVQQLLEQAVALKASDLHFEPYEHQYRVRMRIDGELREVASPHMALKDRLASRIKVMSRLDIAEKRLPQDGRMKLHLASGRELDLRVSTLPTLFGEKLVIRVLDSAQAQLDLGRLGYEPEDLERLLGAIRAPHGLVLVTGPTGSGKTTTLYAALDRINDRTRNIMTVEDPIEYELPGVGQTQVNAKIDLTFAKALRAILRQDPDVIMIGEIRDFETAQIAIQASLTGHLVLATLHTNDAPSAVTRLTDMGVEPFLLSSSLLGVLAQRLVRKLCPHCRRADDRGLWHPVGCEQCNHTGYKGRTGIYELMVADDKIRALIHNRAAESKVFVAAEAAGLRSMRADGQRLIDMGITSPEEVMSVTRD